MIERASVNLKQSAALIVQWIIWSGNSSPEFVKFLPGEEFLPCWEPLH